MRGEVERLEMTLLLSKPKVVVDGASVVTMKSERIESGNPKKQ